MATSCSHSILETKSVCFFCLMKEPDSSSKRAAIRDYLKDLPLINHEDIIIAVSWLWNNAMTQCEDPQQLMPSLGIFECMAYLINKAVYDKAWLLKHQNIYIPYYAAHIIGSYTMNDADCALLAVDSGVIPPLMELLAGKMTWVEQRVAIRALGHLASYEDSFNAIVAYEREIVELAMELASSCLEVVYKEFVGVNDRKKRLKYHSDLITRGIGGVETENRKAEEWASQVQCWSIHLLNCFAIKGRCLSLICKQEFLKEFCGMWGGLVNHSSPGGVGLIRILCYTVAGRKSVSQCEQVVESLCKLSRSSDDWQYMGIDCLLLLLKDPCTRYKVIEKSMQSLVDLVELRRLGKRSRVGDAITRALFDDFQIRKYSKEKDCNVPRVLEYIWGLMIERRKRERHMSREKLEEKRVLVKLVMQQAHDKFLLGEIVEAFLMYSEALDLCPLRYRNERMLLYSNRAQCNLVLRDTDATISDTTRALCLSDPPNSHSSSLWLRSQAYDIKGLAKESLMDCLMFMNCCIKSKSAKKIPYYAVRLISKQMEATWLFRHIQLRELSSYQEKTRESCKDDNIINTKRSTIAKMKAKNRYIRGLSTILEEPCDAVKVAMKESNGE